MNCKQGDLARIVRPWGVDNEIGLFVTVVRLGLRGEAVALRGGGTSVCTGPGNAVGWLCNAHGDGFPCFIADECLRPIRGQEGDDETLTWAGKPEKVTA